MTKLLLTGMGGFAGSHLLEHVLTNTDWHVIGIDSWKHKGEPTRVREVIDGKPEWKDRITLITHDLIAPISPITESLIGDVDYIVNMAAESHVERSISDPVPFVQNNVNVTLHMLEYARKHKPKVFIQISTDEVYGPAPEGVNFKEWSAIIPSNPYSASKACQEAIAISYWRTYGVPVVITNTMNMIGQMQDTEKFFAKVIRFVHRGETVPVHGTKDNVGSRYYLHARNHADALLFLLGKEPAMYPNTDRPDRYNVVGEEEIDNLTAAQTIADIMGKELKYEFQDFHSTRPGHDKRYALDGSKIREAGWKAPKNFRESLTDYINWALEHPLWL